VEILGMFLADSLPPWKLHGTLVNTPSQQTQCTVRQITPTTRFKNCLNYVTGLMPIASATERVGSKPKFESDARIFKSESVTENLLKIIGLIPTDLMG
jgi:hypothetical protein